MVETQKNNIPLLRFFCVFLMFFALYLCWVPPFSSLNKSTGHVSSAGYNLTRFNASFTLDNGQSLRCTAKGWWIFGSQICPALDLQKAQETQESVLIFYAGQKVWAVESAVDHKKIINYQSIRNTRWCVMGLIVLIFLGIIIYAPVLVVSRYDRE